LDGVSGGGDVAFYLFLKGRVLELEMSASDKDEIANVKDRDEQIEGRRYKVWVKQGQWMKRTVDEIPSQQKAARKLH
jgi:hypothetical protein